MKINDIITESTILDEGLLDFFMRKPTHDETLSDREAHELKQAVKAIIGPSPFIMGLKKTDKDSATFAIPNKRDTIMGVYNFLTTDLMWKYPSRDDVDKSIANFKAYAPQFFKNSPVHEADDTLKVPNIDVGDEVKVDQRCKRNK